MRVSVVTFCSFLASGVSRGGRVEVWSAGKRSLNEELHFRLRHEVRQALGTRVHVLGEQNGPWPARRLLSGCRNTGVPSPRSSAPCSTGTPVRSLGGPRDRLLKITARLHPVELRFVAVCRLVPPNPSGPKSDFALQPRELKP